MLLAISSYVILLFSRDQKKVAIGQERLYTVKTKVFTAHHFVPIHTLFLFLVCVLGQFSVQYKLSFLQCSICN